jgi:hypothetical protein
VILAVSFTNGYDYWTGIISLILLWVPIILARKGIIELPWPIVLGIGLALFIHNLGLVTNWYGTTFWWDKMTHLTSGIVIASLVAIVLLLIPKHFLCNHIPLKWFPFLVFISILALEALWEIMEFSMDQILGTHMQFGLLDTVNDITSNAISGIIAGMGAFLYLRHNSIDAFLENLKVENTIEKIKSRMTRRGWYK